MNRVTTNHFCFTMRIIGRVLGLLVLVPAFTSTPASASAPNKRPPSYTSIALAPNGGYWVQVDENGSFYTLAVNGAPQYENVAHRGSIIAVPGTSGYWVVTVDGHIYARGGAPNLCGGNPGWLQNCSGYRAYRETITGAAASPNGDGLWAVDNARHVWTAGNVVSYGDVTNDNRTPAGIVATASGGGYYVVMNDGGVFARGDAQFYGSTGGNRPGGHDVTGLTLSFGLTGKQNGYWLVADDGGILTYGDAPFLGSTGGNDGGSFVTSITTQPDQHSYAWVHANGRVEFSSTLPRVIIDGEAQIDVGVWAVKSDESNEGIYRLTEDGTPSQQWELWPTTHDGKTVQIVNVSSGLCADVENGTGPFLIQYPCKGSNDGWNNQRFTITTYNSGCWSEPPCVDFSPVSHPYEHIITGNNSQLWLSGISGGHWKIISLDESGQPQNQAATSATQ